MSACWENPLLAAVGELRWAKVKGWGSTRNSIYSRRSQPTFKKIKDQIIDVLLSSHAMYIFVTCSFLFV